MIQCWQQIRKIKQGHGVENREGCCFRKIGQGRPLKAVTLKQRPVVIYTKTFES